MAPPYATENKTLQAIATCIEEAIDSGRFIELIKETLSDEIGLRPYETLEYAYGYDDDWEDGYLTEAREYVFNLRKEY